MGPSPTSSRSASRASSSRSVPSGASPSSRIALACSRTARSICCDSASSTAGECLSAPRSTTSATRSTSVMSARRRAACCGVSRGRGLPAGAGATERTAAGAAAAPAARCVEIPPPGRPPVRARGSGLGHPRGPRHLGRGRPAHLGRALAVVRIALERVVADALLVRHSLRRDLRRDHRRRHRRPHRRNGRDGGVARRRPRHLRQRRRRHRRRLGRHRRRRRRGVSRERPEARRRPPLRVVVRAVGRVRSPRARLRRRLEAQHEVADVDLVALADDGRLRDLPAVDVRPVGALEVRDDEPPVTEEQARVVLRHVALREHQVVALDAPDVDLVLVEGLPTLGAAFLADDDREHSVPSGGAPCADRTAGAYAGPLVLRRSGGIVEGRHAVCQLRVVARATLSVGARPCAAVQPPRRPSGSPRARAPRSSPAPAARRRAR